MRHRPGIDHARRWLRSLRLKFGALPIWGWTRDHQLLATAIGVLSLAVTTIGVVHDWSPGRDGAEASRDPEPVRSRTGPTRPAEIVNTWSDERQRYVGTFSRRGPDLTAQKANSFNEHDRIDIRCAISDGGPAKTTVHRVVYESTDWYLTSGNEWLPAVFVRLLDQRTPPRQCSIGERPR